MSTPFVEYTDENGVKSKLEFSDSMTNEIFVAFYDKYIRQHDPFAPKVKGWKRG